MKGACRGERARARHPPRQRKTRNARGQRASGQRQNTQKGRGPAAKDNTQKNAEALARLGAPPAEFSERRLQGEEGGGQELATHHTHTLLSSLGAVLATPAPLLYNLSVVLVRHPLCFLAWALSSPDPTLLSSLGAFLTRLPLCFLAWALSSPDPTLLSSLGAVLTRPPLCFLVWVLSSPDPHFAF